MSKSNAKLEKISTIVNPQAARNKWKRRRKLRDYLQKNLPGEIIDSLKSKEDTINIAKTLSIDQGIIVVIGGDGTLSDVIQGIFESGKEKDVVLGLIPLGSGNAFRKTLNIPRKAKKAVTLLSKGQAQKVDLISINGKAVTSVSIGATAQVTQKKFQHSTLGILGHLLASRILVTLPRRQQEIELFDGVNDKGEHFDKKILSLQLFDNVIGKTNYFGYNWKIAPKAKIDDGFLDITLFETNGLKYILLFPLIYFGIFQKAQKHYKAKKMIIRGRNLPVQHDGEFFGVRDKIEIRILPKALKFIIPKK